MLRRWTRAGVPVLKRRMGTPCSISEAVSMVAALELFVLSERSVPDAVAAYRSILFRDAGAALSDTVRAAGLSDPIDPETVTRLMRDLDERITSLDEMRKDL